MGSVPDGLALALARAAGEEAGVFVGEEAETIWEEHALFHREALFDLATGDVEDVSSPRVSPGTSGAIFLSWLWVGMSDAGFEMDW